MDPSGQFLAYTNLLISTTISVAIRAAITATVTATVMGDVGGVDSLLGGGSFASGFKHGSAFGFVVGLVMALSPGWVAIAPGGILSGLMLVGAATSYSQGLYWQALFRLALGLVGGIATCAAARGGGSPSIGTRAPEGRVPFGFRGPEQFSDFSQTLTDGLTEVGAKDATVAFRGSAVTGRSFRTGQAFDQGRVSDYDLAIASYNRISLMAG